MLNRTSLHLVFICLSLFIFYYNIISDITNQAESVIFLLPLIVYILINSAIKIAKKKSAYIDQYGIALFVFILYIYLRSLLDTGEATTFRNFVLNTSSSILFGCFLGYVALKIFDLIQNLSNDDIKRLIYYFNISQIGFFASIIYLLFSSIDKMQPELFYTSESGFYQRPGDLTIMYVAMNYLMYSIMSDRLRSTISQTSMILFFNSCLLIVYMQFIGSNAATLVLLILVAYQLLWRVKGELQSYKKWMPVIVLFLFLLILFTSFFTHGSISFLSKNLRFFGFDVIGDHSLVSRINIIYDNAITHFLYAPFWGHVNIDVATATDGAFIHSVFSVFFHLGILGLLFIIYFFYFAYKKMKYVNRQADIVCTRNFLNVYISTIFVISIGFTFFTWSPLWFVLTIINRVPKWKL